jgi:hypothetical protein
MGQATEMLDRGTITAAWIDRGAAAYERGARGTRWRPGPRLAEHLRKKPALRQLRADLEYIDCHWALETYLLETVGPSTHGTGHYTAAGFLPVCYWKSPRALGCQLMNRSSEIESKSNVACRNDHPWTVLSTLVRVGIPTASALLTVWDPKKYTILDVRAIDALADAGAAWETVPAQHGDSMERSVRRVPSVLPRHRSPGRGLRTVDRALWHYGG